jgi:hypothetical protein
MNIQNAKKKLREARFFLNHMIEQERKAGDEEPFDFYLSAFLNAGMSVRDAFHVEQDRNRNNAIKAWKKVWEVRLNRRKNVSTTSCVRTASMRSTEAVQAAKRELRIGSLAPAPFHLHLGL